MGQDVVFSPFQLKSHRLKNRLGVAADDAHVLAGRQHPAKGRIGVPRQAGNERGRHRFYGGHRHGLRKRPGLPPPGKASHAAPDRCMEAGRQVHTGCRRRRHCAVVSLRAGGLAGGQPGGPDHRPERRCAEAEKSPHRQAVSRAGRDEPLRHRARRPRVCRDGEGGRGCRFRRRRDPRGPRIPHHAVPVDVLEPEDRRLRRAGGKPLPLRPGDHPGRAPRRACRIAC